MNYLYSILGFGSDSNVQVKHKYGWKRDKLDTRDKYFHIFKSVMQELLPYSVDLRDQCPPVYDQGELGSCTANAIAGAYEFDELKQKNKDQFMPSRLFIYYNEREIEGEVNNDSGAEIRDGMKSINANGVCHQNLWPYDISKFTIKPSEEAYTDAKNHHSITYYKLTNNLHELKQCLADGYPFVFGFVVYPSFESKSVEESGYMTMPKADEEPIGGHAVMAVGYKGKYFIIRNSWGPSWGDKGYFYMPFEYILNSKLCDDFWTLRKITN